MAGALHGAEIIFLCYSGGDQSCKSVAGSLCWNHMEQNITRFSLCCAMSCSKSVQTPKYY